MGAGTFAIVLTAAVLHASWNAMVKAASDKTAMLGLISLGHVLMGGTLAFFVPIPAVESWPFILASTIIHFGYYYMLNRSYQLGDLSQVYPIARGIVPVLVALGAQFSVGETLPFQTWLGVLGVSAGVLVLSSDALWGKTSPVVVALAVSTGLFIAAYSVVDGLGVRQSETALGYIAWLFLLEIFVAGYVFALRGRRMFALRRGMLLMGVAGGLVSALAYGLVIYAKAFSPLGVVSALRETSVLFAALIGVVILGERPWRGRLVAAVVVLFGVLLMTAARAGRLSEILLTREEGISQAFP